MKKTVIVCLITAIAVAACTAYDLRKPEDEILFTGTTQPAEGELSMEDLVPPTGPVRLNVTTAIVLAVNNNKQLAVAKYSPLVSRTAELTALAAFDPSFNASLAFGRSETDQTNLGILPIAIGNTGSLLFGLSQLLPTGTKLDAGLTTDSSWPDRGTERHRTRLGLGITQSLLRGFGTDVNLVTLRQSRLDVDNSLYELRAVATDIVSRTEQAYWDYVQAQRQVDIVTQSLALANDQLEEIKFRVEIGKLAGIEIAAAEAEAASRTQDLINARATLQQNHLALMRLINPPGEDNPFTRPIIILQQPTIEDIPLEPLEECIATAKIRRPEMNQSRLQINRNALDIVKTKNGLLPKLDLFAELGKSGYSRSILGTVGDMISGHSFDAKVGVSGEVSLTNRNARAAFTRSLLVREQDFEALYNLSQTVEADVRRAYVEVQRASEQVKAAAATRRLQEAKLEAELAKFREGKSTSLQVAQVQRDLLASQISEQSAIAARLKAFVELYRLEGTLLERRSIRAPGDQPTALVPQKPIANWRVNGWGDDPEATGATAETVTTEAETATEATEAESDADR